MLCDDSVLGGGDGASVETSTCLAVVVSKLGGPGERTDTLAPELVVVSTLPADVSVLDGGDGASVDIST